MERLKHGMQCQASEIIKDEPGHQIWRDKNGALQGRVVITDPKRQRELFPPPSPETIAKLEALERAQREAMWRLRFIRMD